MTIPKLGQPTLNMISAWIGAIATLTLFIIRPPTSLYHTALPVALAAIALAILITIIRFKPDRDTTLALSGGLGAAFAALTFCLVQ